MNMPLAERIALHEETAKRLVVIERCSGLSTADFCKAILSIATSDHILKTALGRGSFTVGRPSIGNPPAKAELPIATDDESFVFKAPK